jgi:mRNA interferase MazF
MITTARHEQWSGDVELSDWKAAGLRQPCVVRTCKVASIDTRLTEPIGQLAEADRANVVQALGELLGEAMGG